ncbi:MAG TPA: lysylphosphatidylglycerol synthase domain-containing protein [Gammaproteobacteria bacterium]|nr:lysylphosphatidylglycerol synthase domain-containing protein [Gammaproteobacteria bacterium]
MGHRLRLGVYAAATAGLGMMIGLILYSGFGGILRALELAGWGLLLLVPLHLAVLALDARGWWLLLRPRDPQDRAGMGFLLWAASVRDGVSNLLPVARVGGDLVGIRLLMLRGIRGAAAAASVLVEISTTAVNQVLFALLGLVLLCYRVDVSPLLLRLIIGATLALPAGLGLIALLHYGSLFGRLQRLLERLLGARSGMAAMLGDARGLDAEIRALYRQAWRVLRCGLWQLAGMVAGSAEIWLALKLLGHPAGWVEPVIFESLAQALRHAAFLIPAGLGVQEAGFVVVGGMLGLGSDVSLALSLARRLRELAFGVPMILWWRWVEGRRLRSLITSPAGSGNASEYGPGR